MQMYLRKYLNFFKDWCSHYSRRINILVLTNTNLVHKACYLTEISFCLYQHYLSISLKSNASLIKSYDVDFYSHSSLAKVKLLSTKYSRLYVGYFSLSIRQTVRGWKVGGVIYVFTGLHSPVKALF